MKASAALTFKLVLFVVLTQGAVAWGDDQPLHALIDQRLKPVSTLAPGRCTDAEFLRRVSLDLVGMPPTVAETRAFLADTAPDKRERLLDRLFASPHYARHLAATLDVMLMERRPNTNVTADEWQAWLLKSVQENKPWNVLARELIQADGDDPTQRPPARFTLDRGSDPHMLTRDIGRIFFGRDMQCAQCHDHPLVGDYLQSDYHGLLAFVNPSYAVVRKEGDKEKTVQGEKAGADLKFSSVFEGAPHITGPRMPDGVEIEEPFFLPGDEYQVAPADNVKAVPKFSHRAKLAELATSGANRAFNENIANRLWAHMFGRGLVQPLDFIHPNNPAVDPELLRLLGERFAAMNFDIRAFLREIAISSAYQRSLDPPKELLAAAVPAATEATQLQQSQAALEQSSIASDEAYTKAAEAWHAAESTMLPVMGELDTVKAQYADAKKKVDEAVKAAADATAQKEAKQKIADPITQAATAAQQAVQTLPEDKELAEAAQKFVARSQQLATELAALAKAVEEKSAAVKPPTDAWNSVKPTVEAALSKVTPLSAATIQAEQAMRVARTKAEADSEALAAVDRQLTTVRRVAQLVDLNQAIAAATQAVPKREAELVAAQKQLADDAPVVAQNEVAVKTATDTVTGATAALNAATAEHAKRVEVAQAIAAAFAAADAARQKVPDDALLADAAAKLQDRANVLGSKTGESQSQVDMAIAAQKAAGDVQAAAQKALEVAIAQRAQHEQGVASATTALDAAQAEVTAKKSAFHTAVDDITERLTNDFTIASLKPLTPEQLCWSVFRVTGVYDRYWQTEVAELDKSKPLTEEQKKDAAQLAARDVELEQKTFDKLKGNVGAFVSLYGAAAGQPQGDFFSTADQALFAGNGGSINSWVAPAGDNVTDRIIKQTDPRAAADELYLTVLTRSPTEEETTEVVNYLTSRAADKAAAAQELVWGLINSAEFRFNH